MKKTLVKRIILIAYSSDLKSDAENLALSVYYLSTLSHFFNVEFVPIRVDITCMLESIHLKKLEQADILIFLCGEAFNYELEQRILSSDHLEISVKSLQFIPLSVADSEVCRRIDKTCQNFYTIYTNVSHLILLCFEQLHLMYIDKAYECVSYGTSSLYLNNIIKLKIESIPAIRYNKTYSDRQKCLRELINQQKLHVHHISIFPDDKFLEIKISEIRNKIFKIKREIEDEVGHVLYFSKQFALLRQNIVSDRVKRAIRDFDSGRIEAAIARLEKVEEAVIDRLGREKNDTSNSDYSSDANDVLKAMASELRLKIKLYALDGRLPLAERFRRSYEAYQSFFEISKNQELPPNILITDQLDCAQMCQENNHLALAIKHYDEALKLDALIENNGDDSDVSKKLSILEKLGYISFCTSQYSKAERYYLDCLAIQQKRAEDNLQLIEPSIAKTFECLGRLYNATNQYSDAEDYLTKSLWIYEKLSEEQTDVFKPDLAGVLLNSGELYCSIRRFDKAEEFFLRSLSIREKLAIQQPDLYEVDFASALSKLGNLYNSTQSYAKAEAFFLRSLSICGKLASQQPDIYEHELASVLSNLGALYCSTQSFVKAEDYLLRSCYMREKLTEQQPVVNEPDLASVLSNLGALYCSIQIFDKAEVFLLRSLDIREKLAELQPDAFDPELAVVLNDLGTLYCFTQHFAKAEARLLRSLNIHEKLTDIQPDAFEPELASTLSNLGRLYCFTQSFAKAEASYTRSLSILGKLANHQPDVYESHLATLLMGLGTLYRDMQRHSEAELAYKRSLALLEKLARQQPDVYEPDLARILMSLGEGYCDTQRYSEAQIAYECSLALLEKLANQQPSVYKKDFSNILYNIAELYEAMGRLDDSIAYFIRCEGIRAELVELHPHVFEASLESVLNKLGTLYFKMGYNEQAKIYFHRSLKICEKLEALSQEDFSVRLGNILFLIGQYYSSESLKREAEEYFQRSLGIWEQLNNKNNYLYRNEQTTVLKTLINIYREGNLLEEAKKYYQQYLKITEITTSSSHDTADITSPMVNEQSESSLKQIDLHYTSEETDLEQHNKIILENLTKVLEEKGYPHESLIFNYQIKNLDIEIDLAAVYEDELFELFIINREYGGAINREYEQELLAKIYHCVPITTVTLVYQNEKEEIETRIINPVSSFSDFYKRFEQIIDIDKNTNDLYFFRGHDDVAYEIKPSIYRSQPGIRGVDEEDVLFKDSIRLNPKEYAAEVTTFEKLVKMQHYSLPTRLLDITTNPLVALFFACSSSNHRDAEVLIYKINKSKIKYNDSDTVCLISNIVKCPPDFTSFNFSEESECRCELYHQILHEKPHFKNTPQRTDIESVICVLPKLGNPRIQKQSGAFFLYGVSGDDKQMAQLKIPP